jgi:hydrogenase expression/formation protein HypC
MQVLTIDGIAATCTDGDTEELIDISLTPDAVPGVWLLTFLGAARGVIDADEAARITAALGGLRALMEGRDLGAAFADLDARTPQLPPHLAAAAAAGKTTG